MHTTSVSCLLLAILLSPKNNSLHERLYDLLQPNDREKSALQCHASPVKIARTDH